jgi:hypothetical protein
LLMNWAFNLPLEGLFNNPVASRLTSTPVRCP